MTAPRLDLSHPSKQHQSQPSAKSYPAERSMFVGRPVMAWVVLRVAANLRRYTDAHLGAGNIKGTPR